MQSHDLKKGLDQSFWVGRSGIDVHTYKSMQNIKHGDGRDLFLMALKGFLYILSLPYKEIHHLKVSLMIFYMIINH